jgi:hypothetical protein
MAAKKSNPAMDFLVESLKSDRNAVYKDVAEAAGKKKLTVYPIMWGRAKALLGYVKVSPRGQGKMARAKAAAKASKAAPVAVAKRGPGRPRKNAAPAAFSGTLDGIVAAVKGSEHARAKYRSALERIHAILADALS